MMESDQHGSAGKRTDDSEDPTGDSLARPGGADIGHIRNQYGSAELDRDDLDADPIRQFGRWFQDARDANVSEPNAMVLATVGSEGTPTTRTVLLKAYDARGFVFFTNYRSTKALQISENPGVAMSFLWLPVQRQINITGRTEKVSVAESLKYFLSRPHGSQLGAWISNQSGVISSRQILRTKFAEAKRKFRSGQIPLPDHWGGYRVVPDTIEFWQGRPNRLHDRFRYRRDRAAQKWVIERLAP